MNCCQGGLLYSAFEEEPHIFNYSSSEMFENMLNTIEREDYEEEVEPNFWEMARNYGVKRWYTFREGFTDLWEVLVAGKRGIENWFLPLDEQIS
jgi:hypothetical protein